VSPCLSEKCKDYTSCHSDAVLCSLCNCWSDSGCHHSDVKIDIALRNDLSYDCHCLIKKGNDFTNSLFSVHDQGEIRDDTRDNFETALDLCVSSSYYSLSDITATFEQHCKDSLSIIHVNIVSLSTNLYKLENFLTQVRYARDIIAITETRIKYTMPIIYNVNLQGYNFIHVNTHKNAGGVGLYVKNCIDFITLNMLQIKNCDCETLWIEIKLNNKKYAVSVIYRHPDPSLKTCSEDLFSILHELNDKKYIYVVCGDFHIDLMHYSKVKCATDYVDMLHSLSCKLLVDKPTRIPKRSTTLIDHIYTNDVKSSIVSGIIIDDISDHLPIFAISGKALPQKVYSKKKLEKLMASKQNILLLIYNVG